MKKGEDKLYDEIQDLDELREVSSSVRFDSSGGHLNLIYLLLQFCWDSLLVECLTRGRKVASLSPGRNGGRIFFYRVNFVC